MVITPRLDTEIEKKIFQFLLNTYTFSLFNQYIRQMNAEEFIITTMRQSVCDNIKTLRKKKQAKAKIHN